MNADRAMTNATFIVVAWASLMLALAEGRIFPVPLSLPVVAFAWLAQRSNSFRCPAWLAACLGLLAFAAAFLEFAIGDIEARLLSIAHVVVYLTWVVLFMRWRTREYWLLLALSLLQIAVGAVLTNEGWYGGMLVCSLILMLWAMSIFCFRNAHNEYGRVALLRTATGHRRTEPRQTMQPFRRSGATSGASQIDEGVGWQGGRFRRTLFKSLCATTLIAGIVFASVPRIFVGNPIANVALDAGRRRAVALTGYTETVRLGEIGTILESNAAVMRIRMFDEATGDQVSVMEFANQQGLEEPLFRGTAMASYKDGQWQKATSDNYVAIPLLEENNEGGVRQEISLEPTRARLMFAMTPYVSVAIDGERMQARAGRETGAIHYPRGRRYASQYTVVSPGPKTRPFEPWPSRATQWCSEVCRLMYLRVPRELTQLKALAATVGGTIEGLQPKPEVQANRIQDYLSDAERFKYSMTAVRMDENLDPVEDFLVNHRTGNCEFFASAMTLMLRSQGIAARLVNGFKGGYTNDIDGTFEVQQMHAHAWVEAYIDNRWQTFDPTPAAREASVAAMAPELKTLTDIRMWLNELWSRFVLNVSLEQQRTRFYEPVRDQFKAFAQSMSGRDKDGWRSALSAKTWFSLPGFLTAFGVLLLIAIPIRAGLYRKLLKLLRLFGWRGSQRTANQRKQQVVQFYERFRSICSQNGHARAQAQTEREFVLSVSSEWDDRLQPAGLSDFPTWLVEQFYKVRFGEVPSVQMNESEIQQQLNKLEALLSSPAESHTGPTTASPPLATNRKLS